MELLTTRRHFITSSLALAAGAMLPGALAFGSPTKARLTLGYAAITWGDDFLKCIEEIAALGYKGVQLRGNAYSSYKDKPSELKAILDKHKIKMPIMSGGNLSLDPALETAERQDFLAKARWAAALGGKYLQVTSYQPKGYAIERISDTELKRFGLLLTELGKATAALGVRTVHHNHMHTITERPEHIKIVHDAADEKYVGLLLDIAHYQQGGGNPAEAIKEYGNKISILHLKDVVTPDPQAPTKPGSYRFVELGQGRVDLPEVFTALDQIKYKGWGMVELDAVPEPDKSPRQCAEISKAQLVKLNRF